MHYFIYLLQKKILNYTYTYMHKHFTGVMNS